MRIRQLPLGRLLWGAALLALPTQVHAQVLQGARLEQFQPAPSSTRDYLTVYGSRPLDHLQATGSLYLNYGGVPLRVTRDDTELTQLVQSQLAADAVAGLGLFDLAEISLAFPVVLSQSSGDLQWIGRAGEKINSTATGNLRIIPKVRLLDNREQGAGLALLVAASIPTGDTKDFLSDSGPTFEPRLVFDYRLAEHFSFGVNAGYLYREEAGQFLGQDVGPMATFGLAAELPVVGESVSALAEAFGGANVGGTTALSSREFPMEWLLGLRWYGPAGLVLSAAGGSGLTKGYGNPAYRVLFGLGWAGAGTPKDGDLDGIAGKADLCPDQAEDKDGFADDDGCPDADNDEDGIADTDDTCPDKAEDTDKFQDKDGCPDDDNDEDGIADADDKCRDEKEDADKFEDQDGCPDPDNDADEIADASDECPNKAEDKDGYEDEDGCPDAVHDRDRDGIADASDKCPDEPETINGFKDADGCPDRGKSKVELTADAIKILDMVFFDTGRATIQKKSFGLLDQVAQVIRGNPQVLLIEVAGHTDDVGDDDNNLTLSQGRAESVVKYLSDKGVDERRMRAKGYGETSPKVDIAEWTESDATRKKFAKKIKAAQAQNRRVEFRILKQGKMIIEMEESEGSEESAPLQPPASEAVAEEPTSSDEEAAPAVKTRKPAADAADEPAPTTKKKKKKKVVVEAETEAE